MIICPKCQTANLEASKYCDKCGNPLHNNSAAENTGSVFPDTEERPEAAESSSEADAAGQTASGGQETEQNPAAEASAEETSGAPGPAPLPTAVKKQRASLFTEPNSILDRIQNKKPERSSASAAEGQMKLPHFSNGKASKSAGEILNIAIAALTGIGVLWLCFYVLKRKFDGK